MNTESSMNGFPENQTEENFKDPKFRILIVNNKFQTGFDEPMLHTMYVDKKFGGLQCSDLSVLTEPCQVKLILCFRFCE